MTRTLPTRGANGFGAQSPWKLPAARWRSICVIPATAHDAGPQPLANKPQDARIGDPVRKHTQQPLVYERNLEASLQR